MHIFDLILYKLFLSDQMLFITLCNATMNRAADKPSPCLTPALNSNFTFSLLYILTYACVVFIVIRVNLINLSSIFIHSITS
jgi:hypothetical protein